MAQITCPDDCGTVSLIPVNRPQSRLTDPVGSAIMKHLSIAGLITVFLVGCGGRSRELPAGVKRRQMNTTISANVTRGDSTVVDAELVVIFTHQEDKQRVLSPTAVEALTGNPEITCPHGLKADIIDMTTTETKVRLMWAGAIQEGDGHSIKCILRITADDSISPGEYEVRVLLPYIDYLSTPMNGKGNIVCTVTVE